MWRKAIKVAFLFGGPAAFALMPADFFEVAEDAADDPSKGVSVLRVSGLIGGMSIFAAAAAAAAPLVMVASTAGSVVHAARVVRTWPDKWRWHRHMRVYWAEHAARQAVRS